MEITVVKELEFAASHYLPNHPGKCRNLHGHTYTLQVGVRGKVDEETGMVVDFGDLKMFVTDTIINHLDHSHLNEVSIYGDDGLPEFPRKTPTAEAMTQWIVKILNHYLFKKWEGLVALCFVRLYETPTSYAEWKGTF